MFLSVTPLTNNTRLASCLEVPSKRGLNLEPITKRLSQDFESIWLCKKFTRNHITKLYVWLSDKKEERGLLNVICGLTRWHTILPHPHSAALTPSCSIHLIMGGGWEKMSQCQWPSHWDFIITPINPFPIPQCPPFCSLSVLHTSWKQVCLDDQTWNAHADERGSVFLRK